MCRVLCPWRLECAFTAHAYVGGDIFRPRRVCEESEDWVKDEGRSFLDGFCKDFVATGRIDDRIETKLVTDAMKKSVKGLSDRKIGDGVRAVVREAVAKAGGWSPEQEEEAKLKVKKDGSRDYTSPSCGQRRVLPRDSYARGVSAPRGPEGAGCCCFDGSRGTVQGGAEGCRKREGRGRSCSCETGTGRARGPRQGLGGGARRLN